MRTSPRGRRKKGERLRAWAMIVTTAVVFAAGAGLWLVAREWNVTLGDDLCPVEREPVVYWAVLVDATEPYTGPQKVSIRRHFEDLKAAVPQHGKLAVYVVDAREVGALEARVSLCNPGSGGSWLWQNPPAIETRWRTGFDEPLRSLLDEIIEAADARFSPIMEKVQAIAITAFPTKTEVPKRITIISDMLQHTRDHSHYARVPDFDAFRDTPAYRRVWADLTGVEIDILYVFRHGPESARIQGTPHVGFWEAYFDSLSGTLTRVTRVEG